MLSFVKARLGFCSLACGLSRVSLLGRMFYYAVRAGRKPGVYKNWDECKAQVDKFPSARYKKFASEEDAWAFVGIDQNPRPAAQPVQETNDVHLPVKCEKKDIKIEKSSPKKRTHGQISSLPEVQSQPKRPRCIKLCDVPQLDENKFTYMGDSTVVYTDGCCSSNGKSKARAGIGVYWGRGHRLNVGDRLDGRQTNQRAEIQAACRAIEQAKSQNISKLVLYTDSKFTINGQSSENQNVPSMGTSERDTQLMASLQNTISEEELDDGDEDQTDCKVEGQNPSLVKVKDEACDGNVQTAVGTYRGDENDGHSLEDYCHSTVPAHLRHSCRAPVNVIIGQVGGGLLPCTSLTSGTPQHSAQESTATHVWGKVAESLPGEHRQPQSLNESFEGDEMTKHEEMLQAVNSIAQGQLQLIAVVKEMSSTFHKSAKIQTDQIRELISVMHAQTNAIHQSLSSKVPSCSPISSVVTPHSETFHPPKTNSLGPGPFTAPQSALHTSLQQAPTPGGSIINSRPQTLSPEHRRSSPRIWLQSKKPHPSGQY
ncbi:ribonuclease H1 isoform X1 [Lissotriton helveticus]